MSSDTLCATRRSTTHPALLGLAAALAVVTANMTGAAANAAPNGQLSRKMTVTVESQVMQARWIAIRGVKRYRVDVSRTRQMRKPLSSIVSKTDARRDGLRAGRYFVRVSPMRAGRALVHHATPVVGFTVPSNGTKSNVVLSATTHRPSDGFYGRTSEYVRDISRASLAPNSAALVANLDRQVETRWGGVAAFNAYRYNSPFYVASTSDARVRVKWDDCQRKGYLPAQIYDPRYGGVFNDVPIPLGATPASGTDAVLTIWDPAADKLWELWKAVKRPDGWHACWGGRIDNWSKGPGYFSADTGVSASGLSVAAGAVGIEEVAAGNINHALNLGLVDVKHWTQFSYPAQRSDGGDPVGKPDAIAEGQRFRLDPSLDVDSLRLHPLASAIAKAAQRYGFIVSDRSGAVAIGAEAGNYDHGINPWDRILNGTPTYAVLKNFPWDRMQALSYNYGK